MHATFNNFESNMAAILNNMNPDECSREVTEHVQTVSQWLSSWTGSLWFILVNSLSVSIIIYNSIPIDVFHYSTT